MAIDGWIGNAQLYKYFIYAKSPSGAASRTRRAPGGTGILIRKGSLSARVAIVTFRFIAGLVGKEFY